MGDSMKISFEDIPSDFELDGKVVEFKEELSIYEYPPEKREGNKIIFYPFPTDKLLFRTKYMLVEGGFGASSCCRGTMIIGYFAPTAEDCAKRINGQSGNTRLFPIRQSKETFEVTA